MCICIKYIINSCALENKQNEIVPVMFLWKPKQVSFFHIIFIAFLDNTPSV